MNTEIEYVEFKAESSKQERSEFKGLEIYIPLSFKKVWRTTEGTAKYLTAGWIYRFPKYRMLVASDSIRDGDEIASPFGWMKVGFWGVGVLVCKEGENAFRRPINTQHWSAEPVVKKNLTTEKPATTEDSSLVDKESLTTEERPRSMSGDEHLREMSRDIREGGIEIDRLRKELECKTLECNAQRLEIESLHMEMNSSAPRIRALAAKEFLQAAGETLEARGKTYDSEGGERSAQRTAEAFNAITGKNLTQGEIYLLLQIVKDVRQWMRADYHPDSALDSVAFAALKAEALAQEGRNDQS